MHSQEILGIRQKRKGLAVDVKSGSLFHLDPAVVRNKFAKKPCIYYGILTFAPNIWFWHINWLQSLAETNPTTPWAFKASAVSKPSRSACALDD